MSVEDVRVFAENVSIRYATVVILNKPKRMASYVYSKPGFNQVFPAMVRPPSGTVNVWKHTGAPLQATGWFTAAPAGA